MDKDEREAMSVDELNRQIAEINGKCVCETPNIRIRSSVTVSHHPENYFEICHNYECDKFLRPDYLAPENLHELVRVMENVFEAFDIGRGDKTYYVKGYIEKPSKIFKAKADSLSTALAEAIVETKG